MKIGLHEMGAQVIYAPKHMTPEEQAKVDRVRIEMNARARKVTQETYRRRIADYYLLMALRDQRLRVA